MIQAVKSYDIHEVLNEDIVTKWHKILDIIFNMHEVSTCAVIYNDEDQLSVFMKHPLSKTSNRGLLNITDQLYVKIITSKEGFVTEVKGKTFLGLPLFWPNGKTFGLLCMIYTHKMLKPNMIKIFNQFKLMMTKDLVLMKQDESIAYHIKEVRRTQRLLMQYEKEHLKQQLIASIGHEISTPIHIALNVSEYIEKSTELMDMQATNMEQMIKEGAMLLQKNLETATHQLKAFQKLANDQVNQKVEIIDIGLYLSSIIQNLHLHLLKYKAEVNLIVRPYLNVKTIPGILSQVIIVLLNKLMVSFYKEDEVTLIVITVKEFDDQVHIYVDGGKQEQVSYDAMDQWDKGLKLSTLIELVQEKLHGMLVYEDEGDIQFHISVPNRI